MASGIYCITNKVNGKRYIGQAQNIKNRFTIHKCPSSLKSNPKSPLYRASLKYGWDNLCLSILEVVDDFDKLNDREIYWISELNPEYNLTIGGGGVRGGKFEEERRRNISKRNKGKIVSQETRDKISKANKGNKWSDEQKLKIKGRITKTRSVRQYGINGILIKEWDTIINASKHLGINKSDIVFACQGKLKIIGGFHWCYSTDEFIIPIPAKDLKKSINQYTKDGIFIKKHISISHASKSVGVSRQAIGDALSGKQRHAANSKWAYA